MFIYGGFRSNRAIEKEDLGGRRGCGLPRKPPFSALSFRFVCLVYN